MKIFFTTLATIATFCASAESEIKRDSIRNYKMDEVVVTATRSPLPLKNAPVITRVIHAVDIERSGVPTLQNLLERELAGVEFHQAGYGSTVSFQGLDARYVLFLIDGERIAGETYGNIDYSRIPMNNIDRIEIVRGAASVLYGSNAMGAVVNIITRMPTEKVEVRGSFRYGSSFQDNGKEKLKGDKFTESDMSKYRNMLDMPNTKSDVSVGFNLGKFRSLTSAAYRTVDAYKLVGTKNEERHYQSMNIMGVKMSPGMPPRPEMDPVTGTPVFEVKRVVKDTTISVAPDQRGLSLSGYQDLNLYQRFDYELNKKFRFQASGGYFSKERYDFQTSVMDENPMSAMTAKDWKFENYEGYDVKALMEHSPNQNNKIYLSYARNEYRRREKNLGDEISPKQRHIYENPRLLWTMNSKYNRLTSGLELIGEKLNFDLNPKGYENQKELTSGTAYVQDEILLGKPISFVVGLRGEYSDRFGWGVTPKASAKFDIKNFSARLNYSNGYRTPSLKEMYMDFTVPVGVATKILGNDKLKQERNNYFSLALEYSHKYFNLSATGYVNKFKNKIDVQGSNVDGVEILQYGNINNSTIKGLELTALYIPAENLTLSANYNYVHTTDDAPESSTQYIYPSPHTATFIVNYDRQIKTCRLGATASLRYVGAKDYEDFMTVLEIPEVGGMARAKYFTGSYSAHHEGYATLNAAVNVDWKTITVTLGMDNILNYRPSVVNFNSAIMPGRNGFIQLAFRL